MRGWIVAAVSLACVAAWLGCGGGEDGGDASANAITSSDGFSEAELSIIKTLSPLPEKPPPDTTNKFADDPRAAKLGQRFFWEKRIAGPIKQGHHVNEDGSDNGALGEKGETNKIACVDCHMPTSGWLFDVRSNNGNKATPNATSLGTDWGVRNVSSVINVAYYGTRSPSRSTPVWIENDGYADSWWSDAQSEPEGPEIQNGSRLQLAHLIHDHYKADYEEIFTEFPMPPLDDTARFPLTGRPGLQSFDNMKAEDKDAVNRVLMNYGKTIQAFVRTLVSRNAPFDKFVAGDESAISGAAKRGLKTFIGKGGCVGCHSGPLFSDDDFHVIGLVVDTKRSPFADPKETGREETGKDLVASPFNVNGVYSDDRSTGRLDGFHPSSADKGKWRTKALRHVAMTPPYMHTGQLATLDEVIDFYDRGGDPSGFVGGPKEIQPLHLTAEEKSDLKSFLLTLTGEPIPASRLEDIHRP
jgi:cytochrome c peroxidase